MPLSPETQKLTSFILGGRQYTYTPGFYGLCGLPNYFSQLMTIHFDPLIKKKQAITYIDDTIMQSQNKNEMFTIINEYHTLLRKAGLKAAPDKTFFFLEKVKFRGHVISPEGIQPIAKRVNDLKNLKSPECKRDVMKVLGCLGFYSCYIKNLYVDSQPFYDLIKDSTSFHWTDEHEKLFQSIKDRISEDTILAVPSTDCPFHIHVDSSNVGTGCILIQQFPEGKRIISFNSRALIKLNKRCLHFTESFVELSLRYKPTNIILLVLRSRSIFTVTINQFCTYGDAKDNSPTDSSAIMLSSQNSRI